MSRRASQINGPFAPRTIEMLRSPAMGALSLTARRILDRLEIEHAAHAGRDNGRLPITFGDFAEYVTSNRHTIAAGIREVVTLGFAEVTRRGRSGNGTYRSANLFRITYLPSNGKAPTNEWRAIETVERAERIAHKARLPVTENVTGKNISPVTENVTGPVTETVPLTSDGNRTTRQKLNKSPVTETVPLSRYLSIYGDAAPSAGPSAKRWTKPALPPKSKLRTPTRAAAAASRVRKSK